MVHAQCAQCVYMSTWLLCSHVQLCGVEEKSKVWDPARRIPYGRGVCVCGLMFTCDGLVWYCACGLSVFERMETRKGRFGWWDKFLDRQWRWECQRNKIVQSGKGGSCVSKRRKMESGSDYE